MKIVKLNGQKFIGKNKQGYYVVEGYALQDDMGFITFDGVTPYHPCKKALQEIVNSGGFLEEMQHVQAI